MIAVCVRKGRITVSGHAGFAEAGKDIVCAGVTALIQTLIKSVDDLTEDKIEYEISPGRADIHYGDLSEAGKLLIDSFFIGVCAIADEFPDQRPDRMTRRECQKTLRIRQAWNRPKLRWTGVASLNYGIQKWRYYNS